MKQDDASDLPIEEQLAQAGWRQGSCCSADAMAVATNEVSDGTTNGLVMVRSKKLKRRHKLVIVSQTCDIVARPNVEPNVDALVCKFEQDQNFLAKVERNSARAFVIDPNTGLVAWAPHRLQLSKQLLATLRPEPWPSTEERRARFIRWLARRYDRPAIPDAVVEALQRPMIEVLDHVLDKQPLVARAFSQAVHEVRVRLPEHHQLPFELQLYLIVRGNRRTSEEAHAIDIVLAAINTGLDSARVELLPARILSLEDISVAEYQATLPLYLEYHTYQGQELVGVEPLKRR